MKCIICHGNDIQSQFVNEEIHLNADIIQIQIKVPVCNSCGERYYDRKTMKELEELKVQLRSEKAKLSEVGKVLAYQR